MNSQIPELTTWQAEQKLAQLAAIVESSTDAIISLTLDGKITSWNAGAVSTYGYSAMEAIGQPFTLLIPEIEPHLRPSLLDHHETIHRCKDGRLIHVFLTLSGLINNSGQRIGMSLIARDISERRALQKMQHDLISIVGHELRTPLTSLRAALGLLATGRLGSLSDQGQQLLEFALTDTARLERLVNDILDLERLKIGQMVMNYRSCQLTKLIDQASQSIQPLAEQQGIQLSVQHLTNLTAHLWADPDRIVQVLTNLMGNAIKFSPVGATIWLTTQAQNQQILIQVRDEGPGIPADKLELIFEPFQQVDRSDVRQNSGTGLGLAICRQIIQAHTGSIWAESTLGQGSTFLLSLPLTTQSTPLELGI